MTIRCLPMVPAGVLAAILVAMMPAESYAQRGAGHSGKGHAKGGVHHPSPPTGSLGKGAAKPVPVKPSPSGQPQRSNQARSTPPAASSPSAKRNQAKADAIASPGTRGNVGADAAVARGTAVARDAALINAAQSDEGSTTIEVNPQTSGTTAGSSDQRSRAMPESGSRTTGGTKGAKLSAEQQQNVQTLQGDLNALKAGSQVTPEQKQSLKNDLNAMADGAQKPDPALTQALANDLSAALSDGSLSNKEKAQLSQDLQSVMNSANIPPSEVQAAIVDAKAILDASNVSKADAQKIVSDLQAIAKTAKSNAPTAPASAQRSR